MKNFKDMNFKLNIKSIMFFEQLTGKSFYEIDDEDMADLIYAILAVNNPDLRITKDEMNFIIGNNEKIAKEVLKDLEEELQYISSFNFGKPSETGKQEAPDEVMNISKVAGKLIIQYHMDVHYVLYDMSIWEIAVYINAVDEMRREEMTEKRFWSYLTILPHIDSKKIGGPEKLVPFPWEKTKADEAKDFMENNTEAINNFFKTQNKENE